MTIVIINNAALTDTVFTTEICGEEVTWNVTRIEQAIREEEWWPYTLEVSDQIKPDYSKGNLDKDKVNLFKSRREILSIPVIGILSPTPDVIRCFCDGSHRLSAIYELGLPTFRVYLVSADRERLFRVNINMREDK